jgi:hypothetical protein
VANCFVESVIGSIRRECGDAVIALDEQHLRQIPKLLQPIRGVSIYDEEYVTRHFNMMRIMARSDSLNDMAAGLRPRLSAPAAAALGWARRRPIS